MTRTTLNLCLAGCSAIAATWFAVGPQQGATSTPPRTVQPADTRELSADEFTAQAERLRAQTNAVRLRPSPRNPFRFAAPRPRPSVPAIERAPLTIAPQAPDAPSQPLFVLSGIGERTTPQGVRRTAVITGGGQLYVVAEGEPIAGRFTVATIDADAVVLRDASGTDTRLRLR
jgi:hypothetical protein